jgi:hypothetical protein
VLLGARGGTRSTRLCTSSRLGCRQPEVVQPLSLGPTDVTGSGIALRVNVSAVADEGLLVLVIRPFDRLSNLLPAECGGFSFSSLRGQADSRQGYPWHSAPGGGISRALVDAAGGPSTFELSGSGSPRLSS